MTSSSSQWFYFIHYLRNTMGTMGTLAEYYLAHPPKPEEVQKLLSQLKNISEQGLERVKAFAELAQPSAPRLAPIGLADWLKARVAAHEVSRMPGVQLELRLPADAAEIEADGELLGGALAALLDNAQDALASGGALSVCARLNAIDACICVRNTGTPLRPALLAEAGTPFLTFKPQGMGLGLARAKRAALAHGGELEAANVADGVEFTLRIPRRSRGRT